MKKRVGKKFPKINVEVLLVSFLAVSLVAFIGGLITSASVDSLWYAIVKSSITPPNWVFGIVWSVLFFLIALSLYLSWISEKKNKIKIILVFGVNLVLNILWSLFFFGMQNPPLAFFELIALWLSILLMIFVVHRINITASYLLLPFIFWVSFAGALNFLSAFT